MGDESRLSEKWDFRRKENNFDDSSSDDPDSNPTHDPITHNSNLVLDSQIDNGVPKTKEQTVKTRKRRSKKDECKAKQVRRKKPKNVCVEETKKKEEMEIDDVGMFMKTLIDDLTASRESLMNWMKTELNGTDQDLASRPPLKKRAVATRKSKKKKKEEESQKQSEPEQKKGQEEMNKPKEKSLEIARNGKVQIQEVDCNAGPLDRYRNSGQGGLRGNYFQVQEEIVAQTGKVQVQELDCNAGSLDRYLNSGQGGLGRNYFQVQEETVAQTEIENETMKNQKSIVLAIKAPKLSQRQKKAREEANNIIKNRTSSMVEKPQKDENFMIPFTPNMSSSPLLQSFQVDSSFPSSSSQRITSYASNNNFELRQPPQVVTQNPDLSEFQTGQGFENSMFYNNGYFSGFPTTFQPNLIAGGYNFPAQQVMNPVTSSEQRDNSNMFGGLIMSGGAIRYSGNNFPGAEVGNGNNNYNTNLSDYRT